MSFPSGAARGEPSSSNPTARSGLGVQISTASWASARPISSARLVPVEVHGAGNIDYLNSVTAIMGGEMHNMALKSDGTVWSWG